MRLIDGDALYEKARDLEAQALDYTIKNYNEAEKCRMWAAILAERSAFKHDVYDAPTIEPERKTGRWIKEHIDITDKEHPKSFRFHRCSVCNHVAAPALFVDEKWLSYCPHCGAYMGGDTDDMG